MLAVRRRNLYIYMSGKKASHLLSCHLNGHHHFVATEHFCDLLQPVVGDWVYRSIFDDIVFDEAICKRGIEVFLSDESGRWKIVALLVVSYRLIVENSLQDLNVYFSCIEHLKDWPNLDPADE